MSPTPRLARLAAWPAVFVFLALAGCNSKSDSDNPVAPGDTTSATVDDVSMSAVGALDFVTQFTSEIQPLTEADFSSVTVDLSGALTDARGGPRFPVEAPAGLRFGGPGRAQPEVSWDIPSQSWRLDANETDTSADGTATFEIHFAVQYLTANGTPQQLPDATTATMGLDVAMSIDLEGQSDGEVIDLSMDYDMSMTVGGLPDGPYPVGGNGSLDMSMLWTGPSVDNVDLALGMDWLMDVTVPVDGSCPSGGVTMNVDAGQASQYSFVGTYDGSPSYDWTLYETGVAVDSGTETMPCGTPTL